MKQIKYIVKEAKQENLMDSVVGQRCHKLFPTPPIKRTGCTAWPGWAPCLQTLSTNQAHPHSVCHTHNHQPVQSAPTGPHQDL